MNILFLDIDGVLNSKSSFMGIGTSAPSEDPSQVILDPVAVGLLKELCEECEFKIYIHSTWSNKRCDSAWFKSVFYKYGFKPNLLDRVHLHEIRNNRIQKAINIYKPSSYIVLDDDMVCEKFGANFICVDNRDGLRWAHYTHILKRFNRDIPVILM